MKPIDIILCAVIGATAMTLAIGVTETRITEIDTRITKAERTIAMLHTCFPNGIYKADAAPQCPAFKKMVIDEADKTENLTTKGNDNATDK